MLLFVFLNKCSCSHGLWTKSLVWGMPSPNEQRTKPIAFAKGLGWNGHRFFCVFYRSWGALWMVWFASWWRKCRPGFAWKVNCRRASQDARVLFDSKCGHLSNIRMPPCSSWLHLLQAFIKIWTLWVKLRNLNGKKNSTFFGPQQRQQTMNLELWSKAYDIPQYGI